MLVRGRSAGAEETPHGLDSSGHAGSRRWLWRLVHGHAGADRASYGHVGADRATYTYTKTDHHIGANCLDGAKCLSQD